MEGKHMDLKFTTCGDYMKGKEDEKEWFEFGGVTYDVTFGQSDTVRHGGPFDRGSADSYYGRTVDPHYWPSGTYKALRVESIDMTKDEIQEYYAGYEYNEQQDHKKDW